MKILFLTTDAYGGHGGIALQSRDLIEAIAAHPRVESVLVIARHPAEITGPLPQKVEWDPLGGQSKLGFARRVFHHLRHERFALIVSGHINLLPVAWIAALRTRRPPLVVLHGIDAWTPRTNPITNLLARHSRTGYLAVSEVTRERFIRWAGPHHVFHLPNAVHLERYGMGPRDPRLVARHGLEGKRVLMTLGRMVSSERYKGFDEVLDVLPSVAARFPDIHYLACGDGPDRPRLEEKARTLGIAGRVTFTGNIAEEEKADYYRLADVYVMPSAGEGFGFVFLEAMACGVPVIASKIDGSREAVRNGALGALVDPRDPKTVERAIDDALEHTSRGIPAGLNYFSYPNFEKRCHEIIDNWLA